MRPDIVRRPTIDIIALHDVRDTDRDAVGVKAASLAAVARIDGVAVPPGFCVTTHAWRRALTGSGLQHTVDGPGDDQAADHGADSDVAADLRDAIATTALPDDLRRGIAAAIDEAGAEARWAVRSSATVEDLPDASFAGQHDSHLDVVGVDAVVDAVRRCWASLLTDRAIAYRGRRGIDHQSVAMSVVVQQLVAARASGVLFTADPTTGDRTVAVVEAVAGLGDALVAGRVSPTTFRITGDAVERPREPDDAASPLTEDEVRSLVAVGRRIEAHLGSPQDVEWCVDHDGAVWVVQSRPITTLFPIPDVTEGGRRVFLSVGHQQMMTDAMTPLGLSMWQLVAARPMAEAGGRLFVDVTDALATATGRAGLMQMAGRSDPLVGEALQALIDRPGFLGDRSAAVGPPAGPRPIPPAGDIDTDPGIVADLIGQRQAAVEALRHEIDGQSGPALFDVIRADLDRLKQMLFDPRSTQALMAGIEATWWLRDHLDDWLGEPGAADTLSLAAANNITSQMGLDLLDVADVIRPHPAVIDLLEHVTDQLLDQLMEVAGGAEARTAIEGFLHRYGARCVGEIDIARPRWAEQPAALLRLLLAHVRTTPPGEAARRLEQGRRAAETKRTEVLNRLETLPDGAEKADRTRRAIDRVRTFIGFREYPKFHWMNRYLIYKQAMLTEAERLTAEGVLTSPEDIVWLRFEELHDVVRTRQLDAQLIDDRRRAHEHDRALVPPRVITSDGEAVTGPQRRDVPPGALVGLGVSAGIAEGTARVVHDLAHADLQPGDILVTPYTDPSWTPAFVTAAGLVTEVGGLMTHGAVVAREYGLPAVVGVPDATRRITDRRPIRINGTTGTIELLT